MTPVVSYEWYLKPPVEFFGTNTDWFYRLPPIINKIVKDGSEYIRYSKELMYYENEFNDIDYYTRTPVLRCSQDLFWMFNNVLHNICFVREGNRYKFRGLEFPMEFGKYTVDPFTIEYRDAMFVAEIKVIDGHFPSNSVIV